MEQPRDIVTCYVCVHYWCALEGSFALKNELQAKLSDGPVEIREYVCLGCCPKAPNIILYPEGTWYNEVQAEDLPEIVEHIRGGERVHRLADRADPRVRQLMLQMIERYPDRPLRVRPDDD